MTTWWRQAKIANQDWTETSMPRSASPICFRLSDEERDLVTAVAEYQGLTVSELVRTVALQFSDRFVERQGREAVMREYHEAQRRRSAHSDLVASLDFAAEAQADQAPTGSLAQ